MITRLLHSSRRYIFIGSMIFLLGYKENPTLFTWIKARNNIFKLFLACPRVIFMYSLQMLNKQKWYGRNLLGWSRNSFLRRGNMKAAMWALSYSKQQQNNIQTGESSIQTIILPQSLSDRQYLGDTGYHKLSFRHWHLEVSKHRSAWETDVLSFLKTIGRCGSPALFFWLRYSELILFPRLSLAILKYFKPLFQLTCSLADSWLQNWPFCKPSIIVEYGLPLNIFRNGT